MPKNHKNLSLLVHPITPTLDNLSMNNVISALKSAKNSLVGLSPLDGVTDEPFRLVQCQIAKPDLIYTEFVSAEGIAHGAKKLYNTLKYSEIERPIIAQLFGKEPSSFFIAAQKIIELGFDGIDINMGCPAKTVTQHGSGAALIEKPELAKKIIKEVQKAVKNKITVSVKTRLGGEKWFPFLLDQGLDFLTIHGRTLKQGYSGTADWKQIAKVAEISKIPIIGNGDIQNRKMGEEYCRQYGVWGVLIGRAAMGNPWVFNNHIPTPKERFETAALHAQIFCDIFPERRFDSMRKHFLLYASGLPNAKKLRSKIVVCNSVSDFLALEQDFLG